MRKTSGRRGFQDVLHDGYETETSRGEHRLVGQSSAIGDYDDSWDRPGSSLLWVGEYHHLNREEVAELRDMLTMWLETGKLFMPIPPDNPEETMNTVPVTDAFRDLLKTCPVMELVTLLNEASDARDTETKRAILDEFARREKATSRTVVE